MELYIKNMVCNRCKLVTAKVFQELNILTDSVELGVVKLSQEISPDSMGLLGLRLKELGFEILQDKDQMTIEKVKNLIVGIVYEDAGDPGENLSETIKKHLNKDYSSISKMFSELEGITIEKYLINLKVERAKELLMYDELTLSEIAYKLNYSSPAYLSNQFKKVTGLRPSFFKQLKESKRRSIDEI